MIAAIRDAGEPRAQWHPPAGVYDDLELCTDPAIASAAIGGPVTLASLPAPEESNIWTAAAERADAFGCTYTSEVPELQAGSITVYPGGAWMYPRFVAEPDEAGGSYLSAAVAVEVPGSDGALTAQADMAWACLSIRGSLIVFTSTVTYEASNVVPVLERLAQHISG